MTFEEIENGKILLLNKPPDWTSFSVVNKIKWKIRKEFNQKKIKVGHAGTLDPKATGLLIVCTGKFTKKISEIQNASKEYEVKIKLGAQTESYDSEKPEISLCDYSHLTNDFIENVVLSFKGEIEQSPPIFSAIKIGGKRAYQIARLGEKVEMKSRVVTVFFIGDIAISLPFISFKVGCSKGTYIRSLAHDIGQKMGVGAYLYALRRLKIGNYSLEDAHSELLEEEFRFRDM